MAGAVQLRAERAVVCMGGCVCVLLLLAALYMPGTSTAPSTLARPTPATAAAAAPPHARATRGKRRAVTAMAMALRHAAAAAPAAVRPPRRKQRVAPAATAGIFYYKATGAQCTHQDELVESIGECTQAAKYLKLKGPGVLRIDSTALPQGCFYKSGKIFSVRVPSRLARARVCVCACVLCVRVCACVNTCVRLWNRVCACRRVVPLVSRAVCA